MTKRLALLAMAIALAIAGCGSDEDDTPTGQGEAVDYALGVESIVNRIYEDGTRAITTLNRLEDKKVEPLAGAKTLDQIAKDVEDSQADLEQLVPPEATEIYSDDLIDKVETLAIDLQSAAIDIRAADRGLIALPETARAQAKIILVEISGIASLAQAVRALAIAEPDGAEE